MLPRPKAPLIATALILGLSACGGGRDGEGSSGGGGGGGRGGPQGPPEVGVLAVRTETVPLEVELAGRTAAYEVSEVRPQVSGILRERLFTEGTLVRQGQTLYRIDPRLYAAAAAEAQAALGNARAASVAARVRADRYRPLAQAQAVAQQDYTDAVATARQTAAQVAQAQAQLRTATVNLGFTRVTAPISGRIGRSLVTTGALVQAAQANPLTTIQRLDPMFVDIQQSSAELLALRRSLSSGGAVRSSATVRLRLEDGSDYGPTGTVQFSEAVVDPSTGSVTLRARFPNPAGLLLPGMYVRARLSQETVRDAILVPQQAVSRDPTGRATVMLLGPGNKAVLRTVRAERTVGDKWLVTGGLRPGERIITEGLGKVKPGAPVRPVPAGSPPRRPGPSTGGGEAAPGANAAQGSGATPAAPSR